MRPAYESAVTIDDFPTASAHRSYRGPLPASNQAMLRVALEPEAGFGVDDVVPVIHALVSGWRAEFVEDVRD
jgi:hypothetical protein